MNTTKCPFCGGEYKNVNVHLRFCKAKKDSEQKLEKEKVDDIEKEDEDKITDEQVKMVEDTLNKDLSEPKEVPKEEPEEALEEPKIGIDDLDILKVKQKEKDEKKKKEVVDIEAKITGKNVSQDVESSKGEIFIKDFNEDKENWVPFLQDIFDKAEINTKIILELKGRLCHEFVITGDTCNYPSGVLIDLMRNYTDKWSDGMSERGRQTFVFIKIK